MLRDPLGNKVVALVSPQICVECRSLHTILFHPLPFSPQVESRVASKMKDPALYEMNDPVLYFSSTVSAYLEDFRGVTHIPGTGRLVAVAQQINTLGMVVTSPD